MKNRLARTILLSCLSIFVSTSLLIGAGGSETKGKYYFKKTCKPCHKKDSEGPEISPLSKTTAQWTNYFKSGDHAAGKQSLTDILDAKKLTDVVTYLEAHASDSPQPETCGE